MWLLQEWGCEKYFAGQCTLESQPRTLWVKRPSWCQRGFPLPVWFKSNHPLMWGSFGVTVQLVRFPNPLATGSGLGFQYPKKWEIFLWGALAQPFGDAQGWVGAYWVPPDLDLPWPQCRIPTFTQCCCSGAFMSSSQSKLRPPPNPNFVISYFFTVFLTLTFHISPQRHIFQLCWPIVQWL